MKKLLAGIAGVAGAQVLSRRLTRHVPRIFMFHRFSRTRRPGRTQIDDFVAFLNRVRNECELTSISGLLDRFAVDPRPSRPLAAVTVDDGYRDFYEIALPVLAEMRVPATLYVTAGFVECRQWPWWDALNYLLGQLSGRDFKLETTGGYWMIELSTPAGRDAAWSELSDAMVRNNSLRQEVLENLQAAGSPLPADLPTDLAPVTWAQLREAIESGIEVGNHTMTHPFLPGLEEHQLRDEIDGARTLLERRLGCIVRAFAYPNGMAQDHSPEVEQGVKAAGHDSAVVAYPRRFGRADPFRIGRWSASHGDPRLEHILSGASALKLAWPSS